MCLLHTCLTKPVFTLPAYNIYNAILYMHNKYGFSPIADQSLLLKSLNPMSSKYERSQWPTDDRSAQYVHLQTTVHKDLCTM